jgi:D-threo-aldose 1-dehydrogenase
VRQVTLPGTALTTSAFGFGCASLMANTGRAESVRLLEIAFDAGVTYFDVARSYGYGEAESAVGALLEGKRDQVTVATKLGVAPPRQTRSLAVAKRVVRRVGSAFPPLRRVARRQAGRMVQSGRFDVGEAKASLETSLRELGTDTVDVLLLHECKVEEVTPDLITFLESCVEGGTVRYFGVATGQDDVRALLAERPRVAQVVQMPSSILAPASQLVSGSGERALITHSPLGVALDTVHQHIVESHGASERWSTAVGADCSDRRVLARLMLSWAGSANSTGVSLFSSRDPANIRANAALADSPPPEGQVEALASLVRSEV